MRLTEELIAKCDSETVREGLKTLLPYDAYCEINAGDITTYTSVFDLVGRIPSSLKSLLKVADGGILFSSIYLCSTKSTLAGVSSELYTFQEVNGEAFRRSHEIPAEYVCFALDDSGVYYCVQKGAVSETVYALCPSEGGVLTQWDSIGEWLSDRAYFYAEMIRDGLIDPMVK